MRRLIVLVVGLTLAFAATGCMWGVVRDTNTGAPVTGATVSYTDSQGRSASTATDANGAYSFNWSSGPIPALGPISVNVSAPGYQTLVEPGQVAYNDNPNATITNLSSYWEVQHFFLAPGGGPPQPPPPPSGADITPTDLYVDNQPHGDLWVRITNNGPDTLTNKKVDIALSCAKSTLTVPPHVIQCGTLDMTGNTLNLAPGQTQTIHLGTQVDTSHYRYDFTVTVTPVDFTDPNSSNNTYKESVEPIMASLALANASGSWVDGVQFRLAGEPSWGEHLAATDIIWDGETRTWQVPAGTYDLRAYHSNQVLNERLNVGISGTYDWTVLAALDIHNSPPNWWPIERVRIFPEGALDEGPNWLNPGETIPPGAVRRFNLAPGVYTFLVTGPNGDFPRGHHASAVAGVCAWSPGPSILDPGVFTCVP
jgi:hypothetical protein